MTAPYNFESRLLQIESFFLAFKGQHATFGVELLWILAEDSRFDNNREKNAYTIGSDESATLNQIFGYPESAQKWV